MGEGYILNFLLTEGEQGWCARCLEYDFVTQADTLRHLYDEIQRTVVGYLMISAQQGREPFEDIRPARPEYWDLFKRSHLSVRPTGGGLDLRAIPGLGPDIPPTELRELRVAEVT
jgi:hypothetical protein